MRARKCDRCGTFYDFYEKRKPFESNAIMFIDLNCDNAYLELHVFDLCPKCHDELVDFLGYVAEGGEQK